MAATNSLWSHWNLSSTTSMKSTWKSKSFLIKYPSCLVTHFQVPATLLFKTFFSVFLLFLSRSFCSFLPLCSSLLMIKLQGYSKLPNTSTTHSSKSLDVSGLAESELPRRYLAWPKPPLDRWFAFILFPSQGKTSCSNMGTSNLALMMNLQCKRQCCSLRCCGIESTKHLG